MELLELLGKNVFLDVTPVQQDMFRVGEVDNTEVKVMY